MFYTFPVIKYGAIFMGLYFSLFTLKVKTYNSKLIFFLYKNYDLKFKSKTLIKILPFKINITISIERTQRYNENVSEKKANAIR